MIGFVLQEQGFDVEVYSRVDFGSISMMWKEEKEDEEETVLSVYRL